MIKKLRIIFFASASIIALFCVWYPVCYLAMNPNATTRELESLEGLGLSLILVIANSITGSILWMWEVYFTREY